MMKVGIVCEGPSDYPAIVHFLRSGLAEAGVESSFKALFPDMDNTRPEGGWANVFSWLAKYPAATRVQRFFAGGLFGGGLASEQLDAIVIQLDTDILGDHSFNQYISKKFGISFLSMLEPNDRAQQILLALTTAAQLNILTNADVARHVMLPAVESTEAWCVSAFSAQPTESNRLTGPALTTAFMKALETSESKAPQEQYNNIDKSLHRREKYCEQYGASYSRVARDCVIFSRALADLIALNIKN